METLLSLLPIIASVGSTVGVAIGFLLKCKSLIKSKDSETSALKNINKRLIDDLSEQRETIGTLIKHYNEFVDRADKEIAELKEKVEVSDVSNKKIEALIDSATTIKNQLNTLLNKKD